jgi:hypothetical protein
MSLENKLLSMKEVTSLSAIESAPLFCSVKDSQSYASKVEPFWANKGIVENNLFGILIG